MWLLLPSLAPSLGNGPANELEDVYLVSLDGIWVYTLDVLDESLELIVEQSCCDVPTDPLRPAYGDIRAYWTDIANTNEWVDVNLDACELPNTPLARRAGAVVVDETIHLQDLGSCPEFNYVYAETYSTFPPFALPGAPPSANALAAISNLNGLYAFGPNEG
jgi:hypothetical protein